MTFSRIWQEWRDWENRTPRGRRWARQGLFLVSLVLVTLSSMRLAAVSVEAAYGRHEALLLSLESKSDAPFDADSEVRAAVEPLPGLEDIVVASFDRFHFVGLLVDTRRTSPGAFRSRLSALLTASVSVRETLVVPLAPEAPSLSSLFSPGDAVARHGAMVHALLPHWLGGLRVDPTPGIRVVPDPASLAHFGLSSAALEHAIERAVLPRPPLVGRERNRLLASRWESPFATEGNVVETILAAPVDRDGKTPLPLGVLARVSLERPTDERPRLAESPVVSSLRSRAGRPWLSSWSRVDTLVFGAMLLATAILALCAGTGHVRGDLAIVILLPGVFLCFAPVTALVDAAPFPQSTVLALVAGLWGAARTFPWASRSHASAFRRWAPWVAALAPLVALAWIWNVPSKRDAATPLLTHGPFDAASRLSPALAFTSRLRGTLSSARPLADGDMFPSLRRATFRSFDVPLTSGTPTRVALVADSQEPRGSGEAALTLRRDGSRARIEPLESGWRRTAPRVPRTWAFLTALAAGLTTLFLSRSAWIAVPTLAVQGFAVALVVPASDLLARLAYEEDPAHRGLESLSALGGFVLWYVLAFTIAFSWLSRRTEHFQRRQRDPVDARRKARRHLRTTALALFCVLGVAWPVSLLSESTPTALLVVTGTVFALCAIPCIAVFLSMWASEAIAFARLGARIRSLAARNAPASTTLPIVFLTMAFGIAYPRAANADGGVIDASCHDVRTEVLPALAVPRRGEPITERREITLQLLSLIPCSMPSERGLAEIRAMVARAREADTGGQDLVQALVGHFRATKPASERTRVVFALVSEFYDNLSITLFELSAGQEPVFLKLTTKRDDWARTLDTLRPRFAAGGRSFLGAFEKARASRTVRIRFADSGEGGTEPTHARLRSELDASMRSRYRNPLPPGFWERRSFFRLADEKETAEATLDFRVELAGTRVYANALATTGAASRSLWLEGSLASLPAFEKALYESSRDMLMDLEGIYDYGVTIGPEVTLSTRGPSTLTSLSIRHNRGDLAATLRLRLGRFLWQEACRDKPFLFDLALLPGWQFLQTDRFSMDAGALVGLGLLDAAFGEEEACRAKPKIDTYVTVGYGVFAQAAYSPMGRLSLLARVGAEGVVLFPAQERADATVRSQRLVVLSLGLGLAL